MARRAHTHTHTHTPVSPPGHQLAVVFLPGFARIKLMFITPHLTWPLTRLHARKQTHQHSIPNASGGKS
ncbi:hypothetical protein CGRA01v4_11465 [Colletotrichum graminicola]|nr:hypothetical protein CGRA01v4_11465 [Colletotrichum graminicola]